uniref:ASMase_C domain-containing protein n=1 Tax=Heterorhabditis bacteriophora TaxID=37862 RepID=A0A1I7X467_HETBA
MVYEDPEDKSSRPVDVIYSAPSVTPYSQFNPAYRIYTIDGQYPGSSYQVIDFEEHILNLTVANQPPYDPLWTSLYPSVVQEYGMSANLPSEWSNLIDRMKYDDQLFGKYLKNFYRRTNYPSCNEECRMNHLCSARKAHHSTKLCSDLKGATGVLRDDHPRPRGPPTSWNEQRRKHTAARMNKNFDKFYYKEMTELFGAV